jgi:hypothetical protein
MVRRSSGRGSGRHLSLRGRLAYGLPAAVLWFVPVWAVFFGLPLLLRLRGGRPTGPQHGWRAALEVSGRR